MRFSRERSRRSRDDRMDEEQEDRRERGMDEASEEHPRYAIGWVDRFRGGRRTRQWAIWQMEGNRTGLVLYKGFTDDGESESQTLHRAAKRILLTF